MNKVILIGRLGHTASTRDVDGVAGGRPAMVVNFSLAVDAGYGQRKHTLWYTCAWWGDRASKVAAYLTKGTRVYVEGEPDLRTFPKRDGGLGAEITVNVSNVELLGGGRDGASETSEGSGGDAIAKPAAVESADDVPF